MNDGPGAVGEDIGAKFKAAWEVFSTTCGRFLAPEASYQAWFAHYLISQFGIDRVAREPNFKHKQFADGQYRERIPGGEVKLDVVVTRVPGIHLPHYALVEAPSIRRIGDLAVISELKVAATQGGGLDHSEVVRDVWKLAMLLEEARAVGVRQPWAFACILDNHPTRRYNADHLWRRIRELDEHPGVEVLFRRVEPV